MTLTALATAPGDAATDTAPWWGDPLVAGGFLVIGALIAFASNWYAKYRELQRADRARWDNDILEGCIKILDTIEVALWYGLPNDVTIVTELVANINRAAPQIEACSAIADKLSLIASEELSKNARNLAVGLGYLLQQARLDTPAARTEIVDMRNKYFKYERTAAFRELARKELRAKK